MTENCIQKNAPELRPFSDVVLEDFDTLPNKMDTDVVGVVLPYNRAESPVEPEQSKPFSRSTTFRSPFAVK